MTTIGTPDPKNLNHIKFTFTTNGTLLMNNVRIDNVVEPDYASIAEAKRVINGKAPKWFNDGYMWDEASKKVVKDPNAFRWEE